MPVLQGQTSKTYPGLMSFNTRHYDREGFCGDPFTTRMALLVCLTSNTLMALVCLTSNILFVLPAILALLVCLTSNILFVLPAIFSGKTIKQAS
jgi:hypothetical protein